MTTVLKCPTCGQPTKTTRLPLSRRQKDVYGFLVAYIDAAGIAPTYDEIAEAFDWSSPPTAHGHVSELAAKGWVARAGFNRHRSIVLIEPVERGLL